LISLLQPLPTEDNTCVIQLTDVTDLVSGIWEGESGFTEKEMVLTIHENVTGVEVVVGDGVVSGGDTPVTCTVQGGRPRPEVVFMLMEGDQEVEDSRDRFTNVSGSGAESMEIVVRAVLRPVEGDEGRVICCHLEQWDNSQPRQSLAIVEKMTAPLNVLFGPRNVNIAQEHKNGSHLVRVTFTSNPPPSPSNITFTLERTDCVE